MLTVQRGVRRVAKDVASDLLVLCCVTCFTVWLSCGTAPASFGVMASLALAPFSLDQHLRAEQLAPLASAAAVLWVLVQAQQSTRCLAPDEGWLLLLRFVMVWTPIVIYAQAIYMVTLGASPLVIARRYTLAQRRTAWC